MPIPTSEPCRFSILFSSTATPSYGWGSCTTASMARPLLWHHCQQSLSHRTLPTVLLIGMSLLISLCGGCVANRAHKMSYLDPIQHAPPLHAPRTSDPLQPGEDRHESRRTSVVLVSHQEELPARESAANRSLESLRPRQSPPPPPLVLACARPSFGP